MRRATTGSVCGALLWPPSAARYHSVLLRRATTVSSCGALRGFPQNLDVRKSRICATRMSASLDLRKPGSPNNSLFLPTAEVSAMGAGGTETVTQRAPGITWEKSMTTLPPVPGSRAVRVSVPGGNPP